MSIFPWRDKNDDKISSSPKERQVFRKFKPAEQKRSVQCHECVDDKRLLKQYKIVTEELVTAERKHAKVAELANRKSQQLDKELYRTKKNFLKLKKMYDEAMEQLADIVEVEEYTNSVNEKSAILICDSRAKLDNVVLALIESKSKIDKVLNGMELLHDSLNKDIGQ